MRFGRQAFYRLCEFVEVFLITDMSIITLRVIVWAVEIGNIPCWDQKALQSAICVLQVCPMALNPLSATIRLLAFTDPAKNMQVMYAQNDGFSGRPT